MALLYVVVATSSGIWSKWFVEFGLNSQFSSLQAKVMLAIPIMKTVQGVSVVSGTFAALAFR